MIGQKKPAGTNVQVLESEIRGSSQQPISPSQTVIPYPLILQGLSNLGSTGNKTTTLLEPQV